MKHRHKRHIFRFQTHGPDGEVITQKIKVRVIAARKRVKLTLLSEHVRKSMQMKGVGNTQTCSMAICTKAHKAQFPHPVDGYVDWTYTRAYVVSKRSKETGLPIECVVYTHSDDIARWNDSKGGQKKLLADLDKNGPRVIDLLPPPPYRPYTGIIRRGEDNGKHSKGRGAKLRYAMAQLGGV